MTLLIDTHCHLADPQFDLDRDEVVKRAQDQGVFPIILISTSLTDAYLSAKLAHHYDLYFAAGIHPHNADQKENKYLDRLSSLLQDPRCVAVGEIGLDFYRLRADPQTQISLLKEMLILAKENRLPVILHNREAAEPLWENLSHHSQVKALFHCFSGSAEFARRITDAGHLVSFAGNITYPRSPLLSVVKATPLSNLIIETDAPYLAPQPVRSRRNEPAFIIHTAQYLSQVRGISYEELATTTTRNTAQFFPALQQTLTI
ncbi:MAG: TatD family hydrolase [bacterium]